MTGTLYLGVTRAPTEVPTLEPVLMGSAYGLLLNELQRSPEGLLMAAKQLLQCALDLDTGVSLSKLLLRGFLPCRLFQLLFANPPGSPFASPSELLLYVACTVARVENAGEFLLTQASSSNLRGLTVSDHLPLATPVATRVASWYSCVS